MKDKPVILPDPPKQKSLAAPPDFVRNVMGSSAGAGSGEFHVYRHLRRKEYARQKFIQEKSEKVFCIPNTQVFFLVFSVIAWKYHLNVGRTLEYVTSLGGTPSLNFWVDSTNISEVKSKSYWVLKKKIYRSFKPFF